MLYVVKTKRICNGIVKDVKKSEKTCKKWLTFGRGSDIIILALRNRAKLIESH